MTDTQHTEKFHFQAETKQLLDILVHSLYTSREIFLRELISNASDALDKLRFETTRGTDIVDSSDPLEIRIEFDEKKKILTIKDSGIGMSKSEIIANIGTIAKSGSAEFIKTLAENKSDANNIIGKFGVGFYSVFMVAKEVVIKSRSFRKDELPIEWKSNGLGDYEVIELNEKLPRGTSIEIYLKEDASEFAEKYKLESAIKKHSSFISFPIYLGKEKINTISALWREPKSSIKKEQYDEFFKFLTYDNDEPIDTLHISIDAPIQFNSLLFIPKKNYDMFGYFKDNYGLDLYVRRVLIQHKNKDMLPEYLGFVKGVVDSEDLPLNISRETLQENSVFMKISNSVTQQVLNHLLKKAKDEPEKFAEFWHEHGRIFKMGYMDFTNAEKFSQLLRFNSSANKDEKELSSFDDYVTRMKKGQKEIYYLFANSRIAASLDPHLEIFNKKGLEVLFLFDPIDEFVLSSVRKYKDYELVAVTQADVKKIDKMDDEETEEKNIEKLSKDDELHFDSLISDMKKILGERVKDVKVSQRLSVSPACLSSDDDAMTSSMQKIMRMQNKDFSVQKKIFEVNKDHLLIRNLLKVYKTNNTDAYVKDVTEQLFESALLLEGDLFDANSLVNKVNKMLEQSSEWYLKISGINS